MTHDELCTMKDRIFQGLTMIMDKAETFGREKKNWSLEELGEASDIMKDCAEGLKDLAKAHKIFSEHSIERF